MLSLAGKELLKYVFFMQMVTIMYPNLITFWFNSPVNTAKLILGYITVPKRQVNQYYVLNHFPVTDPEGVQPAIFKYPMRMI